MNENINFLYCFDKNYNTQAFSSMISLLNNTSKRISIYVIHNEEMRMKKKKIGIRTHHYLLLILLYTTLVVGIINHHREEEEKR